MSGGVGGAEAGTLTFMVGAAAEADFAAAKALLAHMGKNIVHCGDVGAGEVAKLCNNLILGISMVGVSEAMNLGVKLGMDPKKLAGIINSSSGRCWSSDTYNPCPGVIPTVPASRGYAGGFGSSLMLKDLNLVNAAASAEGIPLPMGVRAQEMYRRLCNEGGLAALDFSAQYKFLSEQPEKASRF